MPKARRLPCKSGTSRKKSQPKIQNPGLVALVSAKHDEQRPDKKNWLDANRPKKKASELHKYAFAELVGCWHCRRSNPWMHLWNPKESTTWKDYAAEVLVTMVQRELSHLEQLGTEGDPKAIESYAALTDKMVRTLNSWVGGEHHKHLRESAMKRTAWPMRVGQRKSFGDDVDSLKATLAIGANTIAADPNARFSPTRKFATLALELRRRIEEQRELSTKGFLFRPAPSWAPEAKKLPQFRLKALPNEKEAWQAVVEKVLATDCEDKAVAKTYRAMISAPSHRHRWKAVLRDKVRSELASLWGTHRQTHFQPNLTPDGVEVAAALASLKRKK